MPPPNTDPLADTPDSEQAATPAPQEPAERPNAMEQLGSVLAEALKPVAERLETLTGRMEQLEQRAVQAPKADPAEVTHNGAMSKDFLDQFVKDPEGALRGAFQKLAKEELGPYFQPLLTGAQQSAIERERQRIVARYGAKAWEEVFEPRVKDTVERLPESLRASTEAITRVVASIAGSPELQDDLDKRRAATAKAADEASRRRPPMFLGSPGRQTPPSEVEEPTEDDRTVLDALSRAGVHFSEAEFQKSRKLSRSLGASRNDLEARLNAVKAQEQAAAGGAK